MLYLYFDNITNSKRKEVFHNLSRMLKKQLINAYPFIRKRCSLKRFSVINNNSEIKNGSILIFITKNGNQIYNNKKYMKLFEKNSMVEFSIFAIEI